MATPATITVTLSHVGRLPSSAECWRLSVTRCASRALSRKDAHLRSRASIRSAQRTGKRSTHTRRVRTAFWSSRGKQRPSGHKGSGYGAGVPGGIGGASGTPNSAGSFFGGSCASLACTFPKGAKTKAQIRIQVPGVRFTFYPRLGRVLRCRCFAFVFQCRGAISRFPQGRKLLHKLLYLDLVAIMDHTHGAEL